MNHLLEIRAICKALLLWLSGANAVHYVNRKIRKKLIYRILRILRSDPVGIQTQDLQNRNLTLYSAKLRDLFLIRVQRYKKTCRLLAFLQKTIHFLKKSIFLEEITIFAA